MQIRSLFIILVLFCSFQGMIAQDDPVLFTVGKTPVNVSEFDYIYSKTNGDKADFSKASVEEYLDLYIKFKLKVEKAKDMQIDTIPALQRELEGYRRQLSDSYLIDKEVKERLLKEAYERKKKDVNASHIMVAIKGRKTSEDTIAAYQKILEAKKALDNGQKFEDVARSMSEDVYSNKSGGNIGWLTALLPNGFYGLESAAYNTAKGQYSEPARTNIGYHIVKVNDTRPAKGTVEVAHILSRADEKKPEKDPKAIIEQVYGSLENGGDFDELAKQFSDDKKTALKGGYLGFFGIGVNEPAFENAAFGLQKDEAYSKPIKTTAGWHIIKRVSKPVLGKYEEERNRLQVRVENDGRFKQAREAMIRKVKSQGVYQINQKVLDNFVATLKDDFKTTKWKAPKKSNEVLFTFGKEKEHYLGDFTDFLLRASRKRTTLGRKKQPKQIVEALLDEYSNDMALEYEKSQLAKKYPDFRSLMREYEEGILLFEVTKMLVWDKASQDSVGLENYYANNKDNYLWNERAEVSVYTLKSQSEKILAKVRKIASKKGSADVLKKINKLGNLLTVTQEKIEKGKSKYKSLDAKKSWSKGQLSDNIINDDDSVTFAKIENVIPQKSKSLKEARGYVIADFQDQLESEWIESLRNEFPVKINQEVLSNLVK